ncbi:MAG: AmmeMemoRadiSam system protein B [Candidatus Promineifilaceae bacterium]|jgi:AmmeMemoRadiSam system protein B
MNKNAKPLLRPLDFQPVYYQEQQMWFLRDPLQLSTRQLFMPEAMGPLLSLLDGQRTADEIHNQFCAMVGAPLDPQITADALDLLDDAYLLENEKSELAKRAILAEYRSQLFRPPALAGISYPADPQALTEQLQTYAGGGVVSQWKGRGIVSPHIDYNRGGQVYSQVWRSAESAILDAELIVILGTDHYGGLGRITLTNQSYATPYGVLPNDNALVDQLAAALGPEAAFANEINHHQEHSVELSAVWLHHIFNQAGKEPCPMVPILVGSFQHFLANGSRPANDERLLSFLEVLKRETADRRVLTVASVDLAHVGPAFGDQFLIDPARREKLAQLDSELMAAAVKGDAESWYSQIAAVDDHNRICGFAPTYLMLKYLGETNGTQIAYDQCPADDQESSFVSICGLLID